MASSKQKRISPQEDEDDEEAAFHSADEGDEPELFENDQSSESQRSEMVVPVPKLEPEEVMELVPEIPSPVVETKKKVEEPPKMELEDGDGWGLDDWDANADDEGGKESDSDEVMATPSSERLPPFPTPQQKPVTRETNSLFQQPIHETDGHESTAQKPSSLWGGWGHQLLSMATDSIHTLTNTVGESLTSVLETVETSLGAPTPEELATLSAQERDVLRKKADQVKEPAPVGEKDDCDSASEEVSEGGSDTANRSDKEEMMSSGYQSDEAKGHQAENHEKRDLGFTSLFSGVSHLFENTGRTIVSGSLDVLESLGKKTFETVTIAESSGENQRRRLKIPIPSQGNGGEKPTLSQALRELKEKAETEAKQKQQEAEARRCNYAALFEDAQGLVHLEALELLSTTCCQQTRSLMELLTPDQVEEVATNMENLKSLFDGAEGKNTIDEEPSEQDLSLSLKQDLKFTSFSPSRLVSLDEEARNWIEKRIREQDKGTRIEAQAIYEKCMSALATFTAAGVEMFHKLGQLLLIPNAMAAVSADGGDTVTVRSMINITKTLSDELSYLSARYTTSLNTASDDSEDPDSVSRMLTNVFYEASNSVGYVQEGFKLMLPIVQLASVRERLR